MLEGYLSRVDLECEWMNKQMKVEKGSAIWKGLKSRAKPSHLHLVEEARVEEVVLLKPREFRSAKSRRRCFQSSYLVDPASSHMLVSKIKPCMSTYERFLL